MRSEQEVNRAIDTYADTVRRICMLHLKNASDTEDIFQEVFLKYALSAASFTSEEHEKAWSFPRRGERTMARCSRPCFPCRPSTRTSCICIIMRAIPPWKFPESYKKT